MDNTQPRYHKSRSVPYAFRDKVDAELSRSEQENIIRKVDYTDWSAPIVVVPKANKTVRICGDIKVITNPNVELEHYPLRNMEDLYESLAGDKVFSQLYILHAYQQLELDAESQYYLTVNTHKGIYRYAPYGVSSALPISYGSDPEGIDDVICLQVATLITAKSEQEHICFG